MLVSAWIKVSQTTIVNCFKKAEISEKTIAINDEGNLFKEINKNFTTADDAVITTSSTVTEARYDTQIFQEATQTENDEVEEIEDDDEELAALSTRDVENSLEILKNLFLFNEKRGDQMQNY